MKSTQTRFVLDSFAVIAFLQDEEGAGQVEDILREGDKGKNKIYMHALNLGEIYYNVFRVEGEKLANIVWAKVKNFPIAFIDDLSEGFLLSAARIKGTYPVSYTDAFAVATAIDKEATLITGDRDFMPIERDGKVKVLWINRV